MEALRFFERFVFQDIPIYVNPEKPDWFVPTQRTDDFLCILKRKKCLEAAAFEYTRIFGGDICHILLEIKKFIHRIKVE